MAEETTRFYDNLFHSNEKLFHCLSAVLIESLGKGVWAGGNPLPNSDGMGPHAGLWFICGKRRETFSCAVSRLCYRQ